MKFTQLQVGQRFVYQGKTYRKATPLLADVEDGADRRLIARSALGELQSAFMQARHNLNLP